jgi:hypothetical protein
MRWSAIACAVLLCSALSGSAAAESPSTGATLASSIQQAYDPDAIPRMNPAATVLETKFFVAEAPRRPIELTERGAPATEQTQPLTRRIETTEGGQLRMAPVPPADPVQAGVPSVAKSEAPSHLGSVVPNSVPNLTPYTRSSSPLCSERT